MQLWTDRGKTKALIRNALNENCLERYLLTWINAENINEFYENYAILRDEKAAILPKLATDVSKILFAIKIDIPELNVSSSKTTIPKDEPIIEPTASTSSKVIKSNCKVRSIDEFEETVKQAEGGVKSPANDSIPQLESKYLPKLTSPSPQPSVTAPAENTESHLATTFDRLSVSTSESSMSPSNFYDVKNDSDVSSMSSDDEEVNHTQEPSESHQAAASSKIQIEHELVIQKQQERISELEQQVLDLTMENTRLRNLLNANKVNTLANFQISIPRAVLKKSTTKNYYIYEINLKTTAGEESWTIFKRYRDFYKLHKELKKQNLQIKVLDFPPKKKLGNMEFEFVEERRQRLQVYIRHVLQNLPELAKCESRQLLEAKCPFFRPS